MKKLNTRAIFLHSWSITLTTVSISNLACWLLTRAHVAISGVGKVGSKLAKLLSKVNAVITVASINKDHIKKLKKEINFSEANPKVLFKTKCDIISPCALGGAINALNKNKLQCKSIVGAANNQLEDPTIGEWLNKNSIV